MNSEVVFWLIVIAGFAAVFLGLLFALLYMSNKETSAEIVRLKKRLAHNESEMTKLKLTAFMCGANIDK